MRWFWTEPRRERIACEPSRRGVQGTRIAETAPAGPPSVRVDTRIEPAHVAHRPMDDKQRSISLVSRRRSVSSHSWHHAVILQLRAIPAARKRVTNSSALGDWWGRHCRRCQIPTRVGRGRVRRSPTDRAIRSKSRRAADAHGNEDDAVGRFKTIARRRSGDRRRLGFRLIKQRERTATRPADEDHLLVAATYKAAILSFAPTLACSARSAISAMPIFIGERAD